MTKGVFLFISCLPFFAKAQNADPLLVYNNVDSIIEFCNDQIRLGILTTSLEVIEGLEKKIREAKLQESLDYGKCCSALGRIFYLLHQFEKAEPWYKKTIDLIEKFLGNNTIEYANAVSNLGDLYLDMGQYEEAEPLLLEVKDIWDKSESKEDKKYSFVLNKLGILYYLVGQYQDAESNYSEALKIQEKTLGKQHPEYAVTLNYLGNLYWTMGQFEIAEPIYLESKTIREKTLGTEHPQYANSLHNLAALYSDLGQFDKSELLLLNAKNIREKTLGKEHREYVSTLINLGILYIDMGQPKKAEPLFIEACATWSKTLGKNHPDFASALSNLGGLYLDLEQYHKAEPLLLQAKEIREMELGKEHPEYAASLENLATLYSYLHLDKKAEQLYLEAKEIKEHTLGKEHPEYALGLDNLGSVYYETGQFNKAESLYLETSAIRERILGNEHPVYAESLNQLASLYVTLRRFVNADSLFQKLFAINQKIITKAAHHLSEKEMNSYLNSFSKYQNQILHFAQISGSKSIIPTCYNNSLFYKGYLLNSVQQVRHLALTDSSTSLKYKLLKSYERSLASQYAQPISDRDSFMISDLENKTNNIEKELARTFSTWDQANQQIQWQDVKSRLKSGEAAIEFVHYNIWNIEQKDTVLYAALVLLPDEDMPKFICLFNEKELNDLFNKRSTKENSELYVSRGLKPVLHNNFTNLYELIWKPLESALINVRKIYYSSSGMLHRLNINAIQMPEGSTLSDRYELVNLGSTRQLAIPDNFRSNNNDVLLFGGLDYNAELEKTILKESDSLSNSWKVNASISNNWNYLPGTMAEVLEIEKLLAKNKFRTFGFVRAEGSEQAFKKIGKKNTSPRILHLATHGFFFPEPDQVKHIEKEVIQDSTINQINNHQEGLQETREPVFKNSDLPMLRSGLILAGGNAAWLGKRTVDGEEDNILTAYEISQMNLSGTELVVLSACETGLGDIQGKEGVYGLQRAFKIAGVKYIIMSLWQVPDLQTSMLMTTFYKKWLEDSLSIPDAFRAAQKEMRDRGLDPYHWAGFVLLE